MSYVKRLKKLNLIDTPRFVYEQMQYEVIMGSFAYGVDSDTSDVDIYGFCIPNKNVIFPHTTPDWIHAFDPIRNNFEQYQQHHIVDDTYKPPKEFDITIYNIVKYFRLCADGNPNMIDSLFVPRRCIVYCTPIGNLVRENRRLFLSKKCWSTFKGYSYSQIHKMKIKNPEGKRKKLVEKYGYDVKYAYHLVRLLNEVEQILTEGDLDIERNREQLKAIRKGDWTQKQVEEYFEFKEKSLEQVYHQSELPYKPRIDEIRNLLFKCLEMHFTTLKDVIPKQDISWSQFEKTMKELISIWENHQE